MSRSGYTDDYDDDGTGGLWRGAVTRSINGKRGQAALQELAKAMDAMQVKALAADSLVTADGGFCALGVLGQARGLDMSSIDPEDWNTVAKAFNIAPAMVREIVFENDEQRGEEEWENWEVCGPMRQDRPYWEQHERCGYLPTGEEPAAARWKRMRAWVAKQISERAAAQKGKNDKSGPPT